MTSSPDTSISYTNTKDVHADNFECRECESMVQNGPPTEENAASNVADTRT